MKKTLLEMSIKPLSVSSKILVAVMGKAEGRGENLHGHVTALSIAPTYRRLGLAAKLMEILENVSEWLVTEKALNETGLMPRCTCRETWKKE